MNLNKIIKPKMPREDIYIYKKKWKIKVAKIPLIPREVWPDPTAVKACSICTSFPEGLLNNKNDKIVNKRTNV